MTWITRAPPNETLVEVENEDGEILQVMAWFGREGEFPHWRSEDGNTKWPAGAFVRWRPIKGHPYQPSLPTHAITLDHYEIANLRVALEACGYGLNNRVERNPLFVLSTGDWLGQIYNKLPAVEWHPNATPQELAARAKNFV